MSTDSSKESWGHLTPEDEFYGRFSEDSFVDRYGDIKYPDDQYYWPESFFGYMSTPEESAGEGAEDFEAYKREICGEYGKYYIGEQEDESDEVQAVTRKKSVFREVQEKPTGRLSQGQESKRRSLFVHSSPTHFPDVFRTRKSAFGSVFVRTSTRGNEDAALLGSLADSSYSMLQSLLNSFERIISNPSSDTDRKYMTMAFKESLLKALELHGISRTFSDGSIHWNIYPISQNYLFSLQVGDHLHQTRLLSRIEDRILNGPVQKLKLPYAWPSDSVWTGYWDMLGMAGIGTYNMPHGVSYNGKILDGMFHDDDAMLTYPNQFKALHCVFDKGKLQSCQFQFPDMLMHKKEDWGYCKFPDRRFWSEVRRGLKPAKIAQKTEHDPPRHIPQGCYDTGDGFYDPVTLMLVNPAGELLRVPCCEEMAWIKKYCRKGFRHHANFRPDLFENWFNYDEAVIKSIIDKQKDFLFGEITYDKLQEFYAELKLLPASSKYAKRKTASQISLEEHLKSLPSPRNLKERRKEKKYKGHKISGHVKKVIELNSEVPSMICTSAMWGSKTSKNNFKVDEQKQKMSTKSSRISFKFRTISESSQKLRFDDVVVRRQIPEKYLKHQPILRPPFQTSSELKSPAQKYTECVNTDTYSYSDYLTPESSTDEVNFWQKKNLRNDMKRLIMNIVTGILVAEGERIKQRMKWAQKPVKEIPTRQNETFPNVLKELYTSIPDREEYCDSYPNKIWNLKALATDKYQVLKYWGDRLFTLDFEDAVLSDSSVLSDFFGQ